MAVDAARAKSLFLNASDLDDPWSVPARVPGRESVALTSELRARVEALLQGQR